MKTSFPLAMFALLLSGCMCRSGVVDCTTGRTYPAFCKPLCGGPCDPFVWLCGDCRCECCCTICGAYTPYGGRTCHGDPMTFVPGCATPPLVWARPAVPAPPSGVLPRPLPAPAPKAATPAPAPVPEPAPAPDSEDEPDMDAGGTDAAGSGPRFLYDARSRLPAKL